MPTNTLIIGAGLSGLTAAHQLIRSKHTVTLLDKGRGVGGRLATRRIDAARLDHGAQFFTVRTPAFQQVVDEWLWQGVVRKWSGAGVKNDPFFRHPHYVCPDGMNALAKYLARDLDIRTGERVIRLVAEANGCRVETESGQRYQADRLLITCPAPQTLALLADSHVSLSPEQTEALQAIQYQPCLSVLLTLNRPADFPDSGLLRFDEGPVSWAADNTRKGISPGQPSVTIHASHAFSRQHLESDLNAAGRQLLETLQAYIPADSVQTMQVHRWRYSYAEQRHPAPFLAVENPFPILFGGDGFGDGGNVEGAFLSGRAMGSY